MGAPLQCAIMCAAYPDAVTGLAEARRAHRALSAAYGIYETEIPDRADTAHKAVALHSDQWAYHTSGIKGLFSHSRVARSRWDSRPSHDAAPDRRLGAERAGVPRPDAESGESCDTASRSSLFLLCHTRSRVSNWLTRAQRDDAAVRTMTKALEVLGV